MSYKPRISVITPVLNSATFLPQALESLSSQGFDDWEHVVVDGGSTDGSLAILEAWCRSEARARLIHAPGLGLYPSVLKGFDTARGQILGWLNADDLYAPWALELISDFQAATRSEWLTGFPGCWDDQGSLRFVRPYGWYPAKLIRGGWFHEQLLGYLQQESIFFTRSLFEKLAPEDLDAVGGCRLAGDFVLWARLAGHAQLDVVPTVLSGFRLHAGNLSNQSPGAYLDEVRSNGGRFFARPLMRLAGRAFRSFSAHKAIHAISAQDAILHARVLGVAPKEQVE